MSQARDRQAGLTLIEVLVVLVIIAVMAGMTVLGLGSLGRGNQAEAEARRLADRLQLASDQVLVASAPLAMVWVPGGYRLVRWDSVQAAWEPSGEALLDRRHALPAALKLALAGTSGSPPLTITPDLPQPAVEFRIVGGTAPWAVAFDGFGTAVMPRGE